MSVETNNSSSECYQTELFLQLSNLVLESLYVSVKTSIIKSEPGAAGPTRRPQIVSAVELPVSHEVWLTTGQWHSRCSTSPRRYNRSRRRRNWHIDSRWASLTRCLIYNKQHQRDKPDTQARIQDTHSALSQNTVSISS